MEPTTYAAAAMLSDFVNSESLWAIVTGMVAIKMMDVWDKRLLLKFKEHEEHEARERRPRRRRHVARRKTKAAAPPAVFE